jgi:hypothetical protein
MYFNDLTEDIQQQWIETNKPGCLQKREKRRDLLDFVVPKTSPRQINPTARTISKNLLCRRLEMQEGKNFGLTKTELRGKLGDRLFYEGLDCGDIIEKQQLILYEIF